jgi:phosphate:Na+ symporter
VQPVHFVLTLLGGLGLFLFGMRLMSDGIRWMAGPQLRGVLGSLTRNTGRGILTGTSLTALLQSSSVVTVMVVSLVNAGMLTVRESVGLILGSNIGTTITAWLVVLSLGRLSFVDMALPIVGLALPFFLVESRKARTVAHIAIGFGLLFLGLGVLKDTFGNLDSLAWIEGWQAASQKGYGVILGFMVFGAVLTALIQSSSAASTITLTAVLSGLITLEQGAAMILGENIGTTVTANVAAAVGNRDARKAARVHFLFNLFGALWVVWTIPAVVEGLRSFWVTNSADSGIHDGLVLATFHTLFNAVNVLLIGSFPGFLVRVADATVRISRLDGADSDDLSAVASMPSELALRKVQESLLTSALLARRMNDSTQELLAAIDVMEQSDLVERVARLEEKSDRIHRQVERAVGTLISSDLTPELGVQLQACAGANPDLERIGDIYLLLAMKLSHRDHAEGYFVPKQRDRLRTMFGILGEAIDLMVDHLHLERKVDLEKVAEVESRINAYRDSLREKHVRDADRGRYPTSSGLLYHETVTALEEIGDRIAHVGHQFARANRTMV